MPIAISILRYRGTLFHRIIGCSHVWTNPHFVASPTTVKRDGIHLHSYNSNVFQMSEIFSLSETHSEISWICLDLREDGNWFTPNNPSANWQRVALLDKLHQSCIGDRHMWDWGSKRGINNGFSGATFVLNESNTHRNPRSWSLTFFVH